MTECCSVVPSIGTWKIYARKPIYYSSKVKFNWNDGSGEQIIEGDDYILNEKIPDNTPCYVTVLTYQTYTYNGTLFRFNSTTGNYTSKCPAYLSFNNTGSGYTIVYLIGGTINVDIQVIGGFNTQSYGLDAEILGQTPINSNSQKNYRLKIYKEGQIVYDQEKQTQPIIALIPQQCLQNEQREYVRDYLNLKSSDYCQQVINGNQSTFLVMSQQLNGTFLPLVLAYESSDERCLLAPIFEVDCISCKTCPSNTCEVICGDMVCCYNSEGIAIDSFPIGELC